MEVQYIPANYQPRADLLAGKTILVSGAGDGIGQPQVRERLCFGHLFSGEPGSGKRGPPAGRVVVG